MSNPNRNNVGPAFPELFVPNTASLNFTLNMHPGMSLRDWFAGQALPSLLAAAINSEAQPGKAKIARDCYDVADAILAAREDK